MAWDSDRGIHVYRRVVRECSLIGQHALICRKSFEDNGQAAGVPQVSGTEDACRQDRLRDISIRTNHSRLLRYPYGIEPKYFRLF
jgi:hypothetical protein